MFRDFFKDRVVDWDAIKGIGVSILITCFVIGDISLTIHFLGANKPLAATATFCSPFVLVLLALVFLMCFPKDPAVAKHRRELKEKHRKERAEIG
jgi:archaellum biogenesis protein FlaJ (TadC family)